MHNILKNKDFVQQSLRACLNRLGIQLDQLTISISTKNNQIYPRISGDILKIRKSAELLAQEVNNIDENIPGDVKENEQKLDDYFAGIRHNLRNYVNIMQGYAEMLLEDVEEESEEKGQALRQAQRVAVTNLTHLTTEILEVIDQLTRENEQLPDANCFADKLQNKKKHIIPAIIKNFKYFLSNSLPDYADLKEQTRILVVDDYEENCLILKRYLQKLGYGNIDATNSGREALKKIYAAGESKINFDILLLDIDMPEINGIEVLEKLQDYIMRQKIMVLMISSVDAMENVISCIKLGAEDFLSKPFNPDLLRVRLETCVQKKWLANIQNIYKKNIETEKMRYENLLHSIFPAAIIKKLAKNRPVFPSIYENVAVLFTDVVNFTQYCEQHSMEEVTANLQVLSEICETVAIKHNLQKMKTIGDGFLATSGMFIKTENPVRDCIECAKEIEEKTARLDCRWQLRAGIDFGSLMGGIVGHRQFLFDIWGNVVNTAARAMTIAEPDTICLTAGAWEKVEHLYKSKPLGTIHLKGKEKEIEMFLTKGEKSDYPQETSNLVNKTAC